MSPSPAATEDTGHEARGDREAARTTHALHVKRVPLDVWRRARANALTSGMHFRDYVVRLLAESRPYPPG